MADVGNAANWAVVSPDSAEPWSTRRFGWFSWRPDPPSRSPLHSWSGWRPGRWLTPPPGRWSSDDLVGGQAANHLVGGQGGDLTGFQGRKMAVVEIRHFGRGQLGDLVAGQRRRLGAGQGGGRIWSVVSCRPPGCGQGGDGGRGQTRQTGPW